MYFGTMFIGIFTDGDFDAAVSINSFNSRKPLECLVVFQLDTVMLNVFRYDVFWHFYCCSFC